MRRKVLLSSLGVGRCFTLEVAPGGSEEKGSEVKRTAPILPPEAAWRITGDADGQVQAESATGQKETFAPDTKVIEVPRQGFDSLAARKK